MTRILESELVRKRTLRLFEKHQAEMLRRRLWLEENKEALEVYNCRIEMHGTFSNGLRSFGYSL